MPKLFAARSAASLSARSITYGIHPTWPSEYAIFSVGKRSSVPEKM